MSYIAFLLQIERGGIIDGCLIHERQDVRAVLFYATTTGLADEY